MIRSDVGKPRGVLQHQDDPRFDHLRRAPSPELQGHVAHIWMVRWELEQPVTVETLPHPSVHLTIERSRQKIGGVATGKFSRRLTGSGRVVGIKFRPAAFQPLYGHPMSRLTDEICSVGAIFGRAGAQWARAVAAEPDEARCLALCEEFLRPRLPPLDGIVVQLRDLVERMASDRELLRVEEVAKLACMDLRRLQRLFRHYVGVTPKWVIQRYRLHEAAERLANAPKGTLAEVAQELGYFDQAHFIRDFKSVVGRPPTA